MATTEKKQKQQKQEGLIDKTVQTNNSNGIAIIIITIVVIGFFFFMFKGRGDSGQDVQGASSDTPLAQVVEGKQQVAVTVNSSSYSPRIVKVKKDIPVELTFFGQGYGCSTAIVSRDFWSGVKYVSKGEQTVVNFTPTKTGQFKYTCTMGMYTGWITVV